MVTYKTNPLGRGVSTRESFAVNDAMRFTQPAYSWSTFMRESSSPSFDCKVAPPTFTFSSSSSSQSRYRSSPTVYKPTVETDSGATTRMMAITRMPGHEGRSFEELRYDSHAKRAPVNPFAPAKSVDDNWNSIASRGLFAPTVAPPKTNFFGGTNFAGTGTSGSGTTTQGFTFGSFGSPSNDGAPTLFAGSASPWASNGSTGSTTTSSSLQGVMFGSVPRAESGGAPSLFAASSTGSSGAPPQGFTFGSAPRPTNDSTPKGFVFGSVPRAESGVVPSLFAAGSTGHSAATPQGFTFGSAPRPTTDAGRPMFADWAAQRNQTTESTSASSARGVCFGKPQGVEGQSTSNWFGKPSATASQSAGGASFSFDPPSRPENRADASSSAMLHTHARDTDASTPVSPSEPEVSGLVCDVSDPFAAGEAAARLAIHGHSSTPSTGNEELALRAPVGSVLAKQAPGVSRSRAFVLRSKASGVSLQRSSSPSRAAEVSSEPSNNDTGTIVVGRAPAPRGEFELRTTLLTGAAAHDADTDTPLDMQAHNSSSALVDLENYEL